jgi:hypothetical protein
MRLKNLFPQDTRSSELISAAAMIVFGIGFMFDDVIKFQTMIVVGMVSIMFGLIQFVSILAHPRLELSRILMAWINGTCWFWMASLFFPTSIAMTSICVILSVSNYVAFIINIHILKFMWETKTESKLE